jgi:hypothetical protein
VRGLLDVMLVVGGLLPLGAMLAALFAAVWLSSPPQPARARQRR